jgi:hypothetical protein
MGKQCPQISSSSFFCLVTFSCLLQYSTQAENCGFSQWVDPLAIDPYQQYIDYLENVVRHWLLQIHRLAREKTNAANVRPALVNATKRLVPSTFTTSTPTGVYMPSQHSGGSMLFEQFSYN